MDHRRESTISAAPVRSIFLNPNFMLLWMAYGISAFGDHLSEMALLKLQHAMDAAVTDTTSRTAVMLFVFMCPFVLFGPVFGWLADQLPRKWIMIGCCVARASIMFQLLLILTHIHQWYEPHAAPDAPMSIEVAVAPLAALGIFAAMFSPSRLAMLPTIVEREQLIRANASTAPLGPIASIAAYFVGPYLVTRFGVNANFRVTSLAFLASAICITAVSPRPHPRVKSRHGLRDLVESFRYVHTHHRVREVILISTVFWMAASIVRSIIPAIVKNVFGGDYQDIGNFQGILGVGLIGGALILTLLGSALKSELAASWCLKLAGLSGLCLTLACIFKWNRSSCAVFIFLIGFFGAGISVSVNAFLQRIVPDFIRGRVFGVNDLCSMGGLLLATGLLGIPRWPNIDRHITWVMAVTSLALMACGIWTTRVRLHRGRFGPFLTFWRNFFEFHSRLVARMHREGTCTIPVGGPVIVAANHNSVLDPFLLTAGCPNRTIGFMIAKEYTTIPMFGRLVDAIECVPVTRSGNDTASVKAVLRHLSQGKAIGIFPAGRIQPRGEPPALHEGVGMLALRSGATVIPAYIGGTRPPWCGSKGKYIDRLGMVVPFFQLHRARVRYGPPIDLSAWKGRERDRAAYREAAEHIMARVQELRREP